MISLKDGRVTQVLERAPGFSRLAVEMDGRPTAAVCLDDLTGTVGAGDTVLLNTTAVELKLGTGGHHIVVSGRGPKSRDVEQSGHIIKLRYTPLQHAVLAAEEPAGPGHEALMGDEAGLDGIPVLACCLHSQVGVVAAAVRHLAGPRLRTVYVMTDGGALPAAWSDLLRTLRRVGLVAATVTAGHAFGGDFEAVTLHSGLLTARRVAGADLVVCGMGPGVVGTGTTFGTTAIEQGMITDAVGLLGGTAVVVPRISFADPRARHRGLSHHTATAMGRVAQRPALLPLPRLEAGRQQWLARQVTAAGLERHTVELWEGSGALQALREYGLRIRTMGRDHARDPAFFLACGAAAVAAVRRLGC